MIELATQAAIVAADAGQSDGVFWLLAIGPAGAIGLYWMLFRYYRNTDKTHTFEREAKIDAQPVTGDEQKIDEVRGTRESSIRGDNVKRFRERVQRLP